MEVTRELYKDMAEGDVDAQLDAMDRVLSKRESEKSIAGDSSEKILDNKKNGRRLHITRFTDKLKDMKFDLN